MHNHRRLEVWRRSNALAVEVYRHLAAVRWRRENTVSDQLRRAVAAVPANIAAGAGNATDAQFARYLGIAAGSCRETDSHLELAVAIGLISTDQYHRWSDELDQLVRMLTALQRRVRAPRRAKG
jgi:four helix bundle protein